MISLPSVLEGAAACLSVLCSDPCAVGRLPSSPCSAAAALLIEVRGPLRDTLTCLSPAAPEGSGELVAADGSQPLVVVDSSGADAAGAQLLVAGRSAQPRDGAHAPQQGAADRAQRCLLDGARLLHSLAASCEELCETTAGGPVEIAERRNRAARVEAREREVTLLRGELARQVAERTAAAAAHSSAAQALRQQIAWVQQRGAALCTAAHGSGQSRAAAVRAEAVVSDAGARATSVAAAAALEASREAASAAEAAARRRAARSAAESEASLAQFDAALGSLTAQMEEVAAARAADAPALAELRAYYVRADALADARRGEEAEEAERRRCAVMRELQRHHTARRIARWYRAAAVVRAAAEKARKRAAAKLAAKRK